jgi:hypothetical protein
MTKILPLTDIPPRAPQPAAPAKPAAPVRPVPVGEPPRPVPAPRAWRLIHSNIVLSDRRDKGYNRIFGDVAELSDGRLVCRYLMFGRDGTPITICSPWSPDDKLEAPRPPGIDWGGNIRQTIESGPRHHQLAPPDALELERFKAAWPVLASRLGIEADPGPKKIFEAGPTFYPVASDSVSFNPAWWRSKVDRHCSGDFGAYGVWSAVDLTNDVIWSVFEAGIEAQNIVAIATQSAAVRSRFLLDEQDQAWWPAPQLTTYPPMFGTRPQRVADLTTAFTRTGTITLASIQKLPL